MVKMTKKQKVQQSDACVSWLLGFSLYFLLLLKTSYQESMCPNRLQSVLIILNFFYHLLLFNQGIYYLAHSY